MKKNRPSNKMKKKEKKEQKRETMIERIQYKGTVHDNRRERRDIKDNEIGGERDIWQEIRDSVINERVSTVNLIGRRIKGGTMNEC